MVSLVAWTNSVNPLNFEKADFIKFATNNKIRCNLNIGYNDKTTEDAETAKFLGLQIGNNSNWNKHIDCAIPKLSSTCFAMRTGTLLFKMYTCTSELV